MIADGSARPETSETIEQDIRFILNLEDFNDVEWLMRSSTLTILEAIVDERTQSIRDVARAVDSDYKEAPPKISETRIVGRHRVRSGGHKQEAGPA